MLAHVNGNKMRLVIAQLNPIVGDIEGNLERAIEILARFNEKADLVVFSELFLTGYPPRDLLERRDFVLSAQAALRELILISAKYNETGIVMGAPVLTGKKTGKGLYNAAILIWNGVILATQHKSFLPTYDVFDETRYFDPAPGVGVTLFKGQCLGISICEDAWNDPKLWPRPLYSFDPIEAQAKKGATLLINISASPFHLGKEHIRYDLIKRHAQNHKIPFLYVNQVGGNDELVFDGNSFAVDEHGNFIELAPSFEESVRIVEMDVPGSSNLHPPKDEIEPLRRALVLGIRDYVQKCGFSRAVIGLSGGIDSAVTCCLARDALGEENVLAVSMPSPYTSQESKDLSEKLAQNLKIAFVEIPISDIYKTYIESLRSPLGLGNEDAVDVTLENVQARIRGNILMAISNKFGHLVLSTGNKSELAIGYCTLYGDLTGGLAAISDVPKTTVYELAYRINQNVETIPREIIERPPSAELKPDQKDQDTLPPYEVLDSVLHHYVEEGSSLEEILKRGFDPECIKWIIKAVKKNEYKRRQVPPGIKVTTKAFGSGRRMPIATRYED